MRINGWNQKQEIVHIEPSKKVKKETDAILAKYKKDIALLKQEIVELTEKRKQAEKNLVIENQLKEKELQAHSTSLDLRASEIELRATVNDKLFKELHNKELELNSIHLADRAYYEKYNLQIKKAQDDIRKDTVKVNTTIEELDTDKKVFEQEKTELKKQYNRNHLILDDAKNKVAEAFAKETELKEFESELSVKKNVLNTQMELKHLQNNTLEKNIRNNGKLQKDVDSAFAEIEDQKKSLLDRENRIRQNKKNQEKTAIALQEKEEHLDDWEKALKHDNSDLEKRREILKKKSRG